MLTKESYLEWSWFVVGIVFFLFFHFFDLKGTPGFHFDEAWAMNYAVRIAQEKNFWPLTAMSPYTAPWAHYWAALWMKIGGVNLLVFRASQIFLAVFGVSMICIALTKHRKSAALYFPLVLSFLPGIVLNHRFAIELNGWHVAMFGAFILAAQARHPVLSAVILLLGITSHVLFYGLALSLVAAIVWEQIQLTRKERIAAMITSLFLICFFYRIYLLVPEKGKAISLISSGVFLFLFFLFRCERWEFWRKFRREEIVGVIALVYLTNAVFFLEGSWNLAIQTGKIFWKGWGIIGILIFIPLSVWLIRLGMKETPRWVKRWFLFSLIAIGIMMLKPAPRYFELLLLVMAIFISYGLASLNFLPRMMVLLVFLLHALPIYTTYFSTTAKEEELHLFFWRDSSRDFLSKQKLALFLGGSGCKWSDIKYVDSRVAESLFALAYSDWPVNSENKCQWNTITRRAEAMNPGFRESDFILEMK